MSKYLVRPHDMMVFEIDQLNNCYRPKFDEGMKNRPHAREHFTYLNLTQNYHFFPITEEQLPMYDYFSSICANFTNWKFRSDGHDGYKGGTFEEFLKHKKELK